MKQIKLFKENNGGTADLEDRVNKFLKEKNKNIIGAEISSSSSYGTIIMVKYFE